MNDLEHLSRRWLDDAADDAEREALKSLLLDDADAAREFASMARFDAMLRQHCRAQDKALLEFAALDCEMPELPAAKPVAWKTGGTFKPWMRIAAAFAALLGSAALFMREYRVFDAPHVTAGLPPAASPNLARPVTLIQPRKTAQAPDSASQAARSLTLAERLEDFYLPEVALDNVTFREAAEWLLTALRAHNYNHRADLDALALELPPAAAQRRVTLHSGPISFSKALATLSALALCESQISGTQIQIAETATGTAPMWQNSFASAEQTRADADALGLKLPASAIRAETGGKASVLATTGQQKALQTLASSRAQLASLAPLEFVPVVMPAETAGPERVLSAAEVDQVWRQWQAAGLPANLPVISLPYGAATRTPATTSNPSLSITATPAGESNIITIVQTAPAAATPAAAPATAPTTSVPATTTPTTTTTTATADSVNKSQSASDPTVASTDSGTATALSDSNGQIAASAVATVASTQGVVIQSNAATGTATLFTEDGVPIVAFDLASSTSSTTASALVLLPLLD